MKHAAVIEKIRAARAQLRAQGQPESMNAVLAIVGGSKATVQKHWAETAPAPPTDEAFRASFNAYVSAAQRWLATQGLMGNGDVFACAKTHSWAKPRPTVYGISHWHPLVEELEDELEEAYEAHLALWEQMQAAERPQPAPQPEPAPEPEPPAFDLANLKTYYYDRAHSPWPEGTGLPASQEVYDVLKQLWEEAEALESKTGRARYAVMNSLNAVPGVHDETPLRQAEDTWSAARFIAHRIKFDVDQMPERARYEGVTLQA